MLICHLCSTRAHTNAKQNKQLDTVKSKASPASATPSRASSVATNGSATKASATKGKGKGKKK